MALVVSACADSSGPEVGTVPVLISLLSGVASTGYVAGKKIETPIEVKLTDKAGRPVPDITLSFSGGGGGLFTPLVTPRPVITGDDGIARFFWILGGEVGQNTLWISVDSPAVSLPLELNTISVPDHAAYMLLRPLVATLSVGGALQLSASPADTNFNVLPDLPISWTTSNASVANVSTSGLVTAVSAGEAIITAQAAGATASTILTVPVPTGPGGAGIPPFTMAVSRNLSSEILVITSDGTTVANISCGADCYFQSTPAWSQDGSKLAITGRRGLKSVLFVADRDGTNLREVASADVYQGGFYLGHPVGVWPALEQSWSADGRLVYVRETVNGNAIETVNADGSDPRTIVPTNGGRPSSPGWGLDDSMITLVINNQLYAVNPDGSGLRLLSDLRIDVPEATWSPDGKLIAFETNGATQGTFVVFDPLSGAVRQFTVPRLRAFCWSPSGSRIALVSLDSAAQGWLDIYNAARVWNYIYTVNADGSALHQAVIAVGQFSNTVTAAWSPDSKFLIYLDDRQTSTGVPGNKQIYAQSIAEGTNTKLSDIRNVAYFDIAEVRGCSRPRVVATP
jgi:Tol biopolymer transport system component